MPFSWMWPRVFLFETDVSEEERGALSNCLTLFLVRVISYIPKMEDIRSSETSVYNKGIRRDIPEDGIISQQLARGTEETRSIKQ
jgi:hypothetical protein